MAATPKNGTYSFLGLQSGRTYSISAYNSDVANAKVLLSSRGLGGTSSDNFWKCPEDVKLFDYSEITGTADTNVRILTADDNVVQGAVLEKTSHVSTASQRPPLNLIFRKGTNFGALQA